MKTFPVTDHGGKLKLLTYSLIATILPLAVVDIWSQGAISHPILYFFNPINPYWGQTDLYVRMYQDNLSNLYKVLLYSFILLVVNLLIFYKVKTLRNQIILAVTSVVTISAIYGYILIVCCFRLQF
jgi:hypothetical protein